MRSTRKRKIWSACVLAAHLSIGISHPASSSEVSDKISELVESLAKGYKAKQPDKSKPSIAVFTLNSNEKLARERVGVAFSELLTHHLVQRQDFTVVERSELQKILAEQRLQMIGAIDPQSAAQIGKLLGADLLLLGSVEKLGGDYLVNARIVHTETGNVLSAGFAEFPLSLVESEAGYYFPKPPEHHRWGFYFLYNYRNNPNHLALQSINIPKSYVSPQETLQPRSFEVSMIGGGIRYYPWRRWMLDGSAAMLIKQITYALNQTSNNISGSGDRIILSGDAVMLQISMNYVRPLYKSLNVLGGIGMDGFRAKGAYTTFKNKASPRLRCGLETQSPQWLGMSFFLNYDFLPLTGHDEFPPYPINMSLNRFSIEPTLAFYF